MPVKENIHKLFPQKLLQFWTPSAIGNVTQIYNLSVLLSGIGEPIPPSTVNVTYERSPTLSLKTPLASLPDMAREEIDRSATITVKTFGDVT